MLYGEILIPPAVEKELRSPDGPGPPRMWIGEAPPWLHVEQPPVESSEGWSLKTEAKLQALDQGESQAIRLAEATGSELLIIDERDGVSREITVSDATTHRQAVGSPYGTKQVRYGPHL